MIQILLVLVVYGVILYIVNTLIPMDARVKQIVNVLASVFLAIWLIYALLAITGGVEFPGTIRRIP